MITLKFLHLLGCILLVGNILVGAVWKTLADADGRLPVVRFATRLVLLTDLTFTVIGAALLLITGHLLAGNWGGLGLPWMHLSYACFAVSGLIWAAILMPIQFKQVRILRGLADDAAIPASYRRLVMPWNICGAIAGILVLPPVWMMVAKGG